nr:uncharacterized protein LOC128684956 isoform X1 [Cherax quadricarinatus]
MSRQIGSCKVEVQRSQPWLHTPTSALVNTPEFNHNPPTVRAKPVVLSPTTAMPTTKRAPTCLFPTLPGMPLWERARQGVMKTNKCSANCKHAGRRVVTPHSSVCNSPSNSLPNSPPAHQENTSFNPHNKNLATSQPVEIPAARRRSNSLFCSDNSLGSIYSSGPVMRHMDCIPTTRAKGCVKREQRRHSVSPFECCTRSLGESHNIMKSSTSPSRRRSSQLYEANSSGSGDSVSPSIHSSVAADGFSTSTMDSHHHDTDTRDSHHDTDTSDSHHDTDTSDSHHDTDTKDSEHHDTDTREGDISDGGSEEGSVQGYYDSSSSSSSSRDCKSSNNVGSECSARRTCSYNPGYGDSCTPGHSNNSSPEHCSIKRGSARLGISSVKTNSMSSSTPSLNVLDTSCDVSFRENGSLNGCSPWHSSSTINRRSPVHNCINRDSSWSSSNSINNISRSSSIASLNVFDTTRDVSCRGNENMKNSSRHDSRRSPVHKCVTSGDNTWHSNSINRRSPVHSNSINRGSSWNRSNSISSNFKSKSTTSLNVIEASCDVPKGNTLNRNSIRCNSNINRGTTSWHNISSRISSNSRSSSTTNLNVTDAINNITAKGNRILNRSSPQQGSNLRRSSSRYGSNSSINSNSRSSSITNLNATEATGSALAKGNCSLNRGSPRYGSSFNRNGLRYGSSSSINSNSRSSSITNLNVTEVARNVTAKGKVDKDTILIPKFQRGGGHEDIGEAPDAAAEVMGSIEVTDSTKYKGLTGKKSSTGDKNSTKGNSSTDKLSRPKSSEIRQESKTDVGSRTAANTTRKLSAVPGAKADKLRSASETNNRMKNLVDAGRKSNCFSNSNKRTNLYDTVKKATLATEYVKKSKGLVENVRKPKISDEAKRTKSSWDEGNGTKISTADAKKSKDVFDVKPEISLDEAHKLKTPFDMSEKSSDDDGKPNSSPNIVKKQQISTDEAEKPQNATDELRRPKKFHEMKARSLADDTQKLKRTPRLISCMKSARSLSDIESLDKTPLVKLHMLNTLCDKPRKVRNDSNGSSGGGSVTDASNRATNTRVALVRMGNVKSCCVDAEKLGVTCDINSLTVDETEATEVVEALTEDNRNQSEGKYVNSKAAVVDVSETKDSSVLYDGEDLLPAATAEESVPLRGTTEKPVPLAGTAEEPVPLRGTTEKPVPLAGTAEEPVPLRGATEKPVPLAGTAEEPVPLRGATEKPVPLAGTAEEPVPLRGTAEKPVPLAGTAEEPVPLRGTTEKPVPLAGTAEEPVPLRGTAEKPVPLAGTAEEPVPLRGATEKPVPLAGTAEEPVPLRGTTEKPVPLAGTAEEPVPLRGTAEKSVPLAGTAEEPVPLTGTEKEPVPLTGTGEEPVPLTGTGEEPVPLTGTGEEPVPLTGTGEEPVPLRGTAEKPVPLAGTAEEPVPLTDTEKEPVPLTGTGEEPVPLTGTGEEPVPLTGTGEEPVPLTDTGEEPVPLTGTGEEPVPLTDTGEEPVPLTGSGEEPVPLTGTGEEPVPLTGTGEEPVPFTGTGEEPVPFTGTGEEPVVLIGTEEEPLALTGTEKEPLKLRNLDTVVSNTQDIAMSDISSADEMLATCEEEASEVSKEVSEVSEEVSEVSEEEVSEVSSAADILAMYTRDVSQVNTADTLATDTDDMPELSTEEFEDICSADFLEMNTEEMLATFAADMPVVSNEEMLATSVPDMPIMSNEEILEDMSEADDSTDEDSRMTSDESDEWGDFHLELEPPSLDFIESERRGDDSDDTRSRDESTMNRSRHGCEGHMGLRSSDIGIQNRDSDDLLSLNSCKQRGSCSSIYSDSSSSRCSRVKRHGKDPFAKHSGSLETEDNMMDECSLSRSVGEDFFGSFRENFKRHQKEDFSDSLKDMKSKSGSLTNIHDSSRQLKCKIKDVFSTSRSLSNIHDTLNSSISNLYSGRCYLTRSSSRLNAKDLIQEKLDMVSHKYRGSRSTSCLNKDYSMNNLEKVDWNSTTKLSSGWDNVRRNVLEKNIFLNTKRTSGETRERDCLSEKAKTVGRGWEKLRRKIMEDKRKKEQEKSDEVFKQGGGEEESEWLNTREATVENCVRASATNLRPPRFSEIFTGIKEVQKAHQQVLDKSTDSTKDKKKKKKKTKYKKKSKSNEDKDKMKWQYTKPLSSSCAQTMNDYGMELVKSVEESPGSDAERNSQESGLGSSFEDESQSYDSRSSCSSSPPSPTAPRQVFNAITQYLCTVDLVESEEDVDSFSRDAEIIDPDELMLLTDSEEMLSWNDIIISSSRRDAGDNCDLKEESGELKVNFLPGGSLSVREEKVDQILDQLLGSDYPSLGWDALDERMWTPDKPPVETKVSDSNTTGDEETEIKNEVGLQEPSGELQEQSPTDQKIEEVLQKDVDVNNSPTLEGMNNCVEVKKEEAPLEAHNSDSSLITADKPEDPVPAVSTEDTDDARGRSRTKEDPHTKDSGTSAERSVSCSDNIRVFLMKQPCAHAHKDGNAHPMCSDKHVLDISAADATLGEAVQECSNHLPKKDKSQKAKKKAARRAAESRRMLRQVTKSNSWFRMFCTTPVTVGGLASDLESHDTDPEPLPPPIPPHGVESGAITEVHPVSASEQLDPDFMTPDEAQRLLSANILEGKFREAHGLLSDEEAQEVVLLLSPQEQDTSKCVPPVPPHHPEAVPSVPPHYADTTTAVLPQYTEGAPPVPSHYTPGEDEYDTRVASHFDPTLTSPLSPEDAPSEADSSETSGDVYQVSRVKEVLVEDGVHYLEDGHFWVEIPGLPDEDEDEDNDPSMPFHPHTKLTFSKDPVQVFSTYSVTEYDRKNDDVDPVAASAEYELEKRVEKMDLFPVEIVKGEGGLGLSIIGMGVGADAGVEKLGIFVKTITPGGATERDRRIQVNDQIIEVDGKSLVGVTQVFAASVLKNTSGRVHFLIGREKDPENSEVALLIKQSLQADREREERRRALGGPDYDPHTGHGLFDPLSSPSEENSRSEEASMQHNYSSYLEGGSSPTSPEATSPPPEVFDLEGDTDTSPDNDVAMLKLKLKEVQYRNAVAEAEITKLKMTLLEMEKVVTENTQYTSQLLDAQNKMVEMDCQLQSKLSEVSTYQDMLEQSQGQFIVLEKKYYKAKKIIKEYQGRERDFLHREEYHITQLEEKDSHYNALVKALKDRVISLEAELTNAQKKAGLPVQVPTDTTTQPAYWNLQQSTQSALAKLPVKEELDEAVPPHELLDVSASRAKGELASRGGLANRHLPSLKKTTSMSSASSQDQSLDDSSLDEELPEAVKPPPPAEATQDGQQDQGSRRSAEPQESSLPPHSPPPATSSITQAKLPQPPSYTQATMGSMSHLGSPPPYHHPPIQFASPRQPFTPSYVTSDPSIGLPTRPLGGSTDVQTHQSRSESRPEIPYRHPPPVARVQPVNRAEISESASLAAHLANRTPQQQSLAEQLKALLAERELDSDGSQQRSEREASPSKRSPTSLMEDVRQAVLQADVSSSVPTQQYWQHLGKKPVISAPVPLSSTAHGVVGQGQVVHPVSSPQRLQSAFYSPGGRESVRDSSGGSPRLGRSSIHASPLSGVSANPSGVVLLSQKPLDSSLPAHKLGPGVDGSSGDLSSGPASLGSGDEGSGASLGSQSSLSLTQPPTERTKRSHMWQTAPVVDWTKEQVSQWLVVQGLESCVGRFQDIGMTGPRLLNLDVRDLKSLGLPAEDKSKLKRKVKELRLAVEKERKQAEKEKKEREKLQKKAEKLAEKAEKKKK